MEKHERYTVRAKKSLYENKIRKEIQYSKKKEKYIKINDFLTVHFETY